MGTHFVVTVETTTRVAGQRGPTRDATMQRALEQLAPWHPAVSESAAGNLVATITIAAENLRQAVATGLIIVEDATGLTALALVEALPEEVRDARQGWDAKSDMLSVTETADRLGVSRQRVLQMIDEGKLPRTRVGRSYTLPAAAVDALAAAGS